MSTRIFTWLSVALLSFIFSCNKDKKEEAIDEKKITSAAYLIMSGSDDYDRTQITIVELYTKVGAGKKESLLKGQTLSFNSNVLLNARQVIGSTITALNARDATLPNLPIPKLLEEKLKTVSGFQKVTTLSGSQTTQMITGDAVQLAVSDSKNLKGPLEILFSVFSTPAYAQTPGAEIKVVNDVIEGIIGFLEGCTPVVSVVNGPDPLNFAAPIIDTQLYFKGIVGTGYIMGTAQCAAATFVLGKKVGKLWDFVADAVGKAMDPNNSYSAADFSNDYHNQSGETAPSGNAGPAGGGWGDPHINTFDGSYFDMQGVGEFIAAKSTENSFELQVRQQENPIFNNRRVVSFNTACVINTGSNIIQFEANPKRLIVNQQETDLNFFEISLKSGEKMVKVGSQMKVFTNNQDELHVRINDQTNSLDYTLFLGPSRHSKMNGLLGNNDGIVSNDILTKDGQFVNHLVFKDFYPKYPDSWRITRQSSLFKYDSGKDTDSYTDKSFPSERPVISEADLAAARNICSQAGVSQEPALSSCAFDVALTGNKISATNYLQAELAFAKPPLPIDGKWEYYRGEGCPTLVGSIYDFRNGQTVLIHTVPSAYNFLVGDIMMAGIVKSGVNKYLSKEVLTRSIGGSPGITAAAIEYLPETDELHIVHINNDVCNPEFWMKRVK